MSPLTGKQRKYLKGLAHGDRPPLFQVGRDGLADNVMASLDSALTSHELVKVQFLEKGDIDRKAYARSIAERLGAELVQLIGYKASFYRANTEEPRIVLPG